jgi:xanthine dehydrogenase YagR molybdenum-binding subunit
VRHHGQIIGLVVAESFEQARDAAGLVEVSYTARPPMASFEAGIPNAVEPELPPEWPPVDVLAPGVGSIDEALAASDVVVRATYHQPGEHHNPMEPHAAVAQWDGELLTVHSGTQGAATHARELAAMIGVDPANVRVVSPYVGGGFGGKAVTWSAIALAAAAARAVDRPVKLAVTREQLFTVTGHRGVARQEVALGVDRNRALLAVKHSVVSGCPNSSNGFETAGIISLSVYRSLNLHQGHTVVHLDLPPHTIMRGPGSATGSFALECAMDELAVKLEMDPIELRMASYSTADNVTGLPWSSKHLDECYRVGADRFGWSRRNPTPGSVVDGEWYVGMGMAGGMVGGPRNSTAVQVRFLADGTAVVANATSDLGTGQWTVLSTMGAESLGIPPERIRPRLGDSNHPRDPANPFDGNAVGSGTTAKVAPAVQVAAKAAVLALVQHAIGNQRSPFHGLPAQDVRYEAGELSGGGQRLGFGPLLRMTGTDGIGATEIARPDDDLRKYTVSSFIAHFCEVRVHRWTSEPRISRMTAVVDAGRIINQRPATNQITGALAMAIGQALLEESRVEPDTGRIANANLADYLIATNADLPKIDVHFLDYPDTINSPVGARGIGELASVGSAAAIANAVYNATGIRVRDLPLTLDKLLRA